MATKKLTMATLAGGVAAMVVGYLLNGMLMMDFYTTNVGSATGVFKEVPIWWSLILGQVLFAGFLTMIIGWRGDSSAGAGLKTGALVGLVLGLSLNFTFYGTANIANLTATLVRPVVIMIQTGIIGAVIGAVLGVGSAAAVPAYTSAPPPPPPPAPAADQHTRERSAGM